MAKPAPKIKPVTRKLKGQELQALLRGIKPKETPQGYISSPRYRTAPLEPKLSHQQAWRERSANMAGTVHNERPERQKMLEEGDPKTYTKLVKENMPLAESLSKIAKNTGISPEDAKGIAFLALAEALKRFDPSKGVKPSTYLTPTIRGALLHEMRDKTHLGKSIGRKAFEAYPAIREALEKIQQKNPEKTPTAEEISKITNIPKKTVDRVLEGQKGMLSLDYTGDEDGEGPKRGLTNIHLQPEFEDKNAEMNQALKLLHTPGFLTEIERLILILDFGKRMKQREIGKTLGLNQMRVSRIRTEALRKLREEMDR